MLEKRSLELSFSYKLLIVKSAKNCRESHEENL